MNINEYKIEEVAKIVGGKLFRNNYLQNVITDLLTDSRHVIKPESSLFFALLGRNDGHNYIESLIEKGITNFIISNLKDSYSNYPANFVLVDNTLVALQKLAAHHRKQFDIPVVGITGSNGKTILNTPQDR